ncbi:MAG: serine/threonine-protein kinase [Pirellulaceae bacterium]|nr:serine/threonine-protein kinase [Pirellulaceae bacterium]
MTPTFDPYHQWLGIPPQEQPANHYRLLGLEQFAADPNQIAQAADFKMAQVRTYQLGPHGAISQRILNELATARIMLVDPRRKAAYDQVLRSAVPGVTADAQSLPAQLPTPAPQPSRLPTAAVGAEPQPGQMFGKYKIVERVSSSSLGRIHKTQHLETGRYYFLKTLPPEAAKSPEVQKRFQREIEIVTKLDHPNLIVGREAGQFGGAPYLIMEYVLGTDLATLVKQQGPLAIDDAVEYVLQTARGLESLHGHGIFHRNLKPHVLMVDLQGNVRITNLLLAKLGEASSIAGGDEALTMQGEAMGSVDYLPPEQAIDPRQADQRSDLYALGCTLYFLLAGKPPYAAKNAMQKVLAHRSAPIPALKAVRPETPAWLDAAYQKLLAKEPAGRFANASELIKALAPAGPVVTGSIEKPKSWFGKILAKIGLGK